MQIPYDLQERIGLDFIRQNRIKVMKLIKTEEDYKEALQRLEQIFFAEENTPESDEAEVLVLLIENYEQQHFPIGPPDPIEAIKIRMEELDLKQKDMIGILGGKSRVSEVLNRKKRLTVEMIRALSEKLKISASTLINDYPLAD
jgi:HTH-type transcriptional regulator/antitoxin HigA